MTPILQIIIVTYNTRDDLAACLASLHRSPPACLADIVVVDNASTDGSVALVRDQWPGVHLTTLDRNIGFGAANNIALHACRTPLALLLNSDTIVPPGAVDELVDRLQARGAAAAGPKLVNAAGRPEISFGPMLTPWREGIQRWRVRRAARDGWFAQRATQRLVAQERFVDWVSGACLLVRVEAARSAGFFDERFFLYEEDVDFCAALRAGGGTILYAPSAVVIHRRGRSPRPAGPSAYDRSHLAFYEKHAPGWAPWLRAWQRIRGRAVR